jgi:tRNA pseudouridine13 synthase
MEATREGDESAIFRKAWRESKSPASCLEIAPIRLGYERAMLERLLERPDDHLGAFRTLPNSLQLLMVHSIQSLVFNHSLSARLEAGLPITEPVVGDLVAPLQPNGRIDVGKMALVSETNLERCKRNCGLGRLAVTGPLPGREAAYATGGPGECEKSALGYTDLADVKWTVPRIPRLTTSGTRRALSVPFRDISVEQAPEVSDSLFERWASGPSEGERWHPDGACLRLRFTLPPGTYATVLMREFMRSPLDHY